MVAWLLKKCSFLHRKIVNVFFICKYSIEEIKYLRKTKLTDLRRGTGGRSSFNGLVVTLFGASGFLGRYVANQFGKIGTQLIIPYRGDETEVRRLKLVGDLGQVLFQPFNLYDEKSISKCIQYSNVVVNLIGRDWETKNFTFCDVHIDGAVRLARLAKKANVEKFIHVSALNVVENPKPYMLKYGSKWLASKWEGEEAVKKEFPEAIIFRPADIYGQEDRFVKYYCSLWRHNFKGMPLYENGETTEKQPIYVSDVAKGIVAACFNKKSIGKTYQAIGPKRYLLSELVDWFHRLIRKDREWGYIRYNLSYDPLFKLRVSILPYLTTGHPLNNLHWERVEREAHSDNIEGDLPTLEDLGVELTNMEDQVPWEVRLYKLHSYAEKELMEYDIIEPPKTIQNSNEHE